MIEQRLLEAERVAARHKLSQTEKKLSHIIYEQTGNDRSFAVARSKGDQAPFGKSTQAMPPSPRQDRNAKAAPTLYLAHQKQHDDYHQQQANDATGAVTPALAVRPAWNCADQQQQQNDQKYCTQAHDFTLSVPAIANT